MSGRFVTIRKVHDAVEAEMLVDLLEQEGIAASTPGAAQAGYLGNIAAAVMETPLQVLEEDADRARAIIGALEDFDEIVPEDVRPPEMDERDGPYRGGSRDDGELPPRKKITAVAAALIMPSVIGAFGAGHFYTREYKLGFILLFGAWLCILSGLVAHPALIFLVPVIVAFDIWGALKIIDRQR